MVGWHHQLDGHEFEQTQGDSEGQRSLACCTVHGVAKSQTRVSDWTITTLGERTRVLLRPWEKGILLWDTCMNGNKDAVRNLGRFIYGPYPFLCVSHDLPDLSHIFLLLFICLSVLTALFSPPVVLLSVHSFCFLETPPRFLLFQNLCCCFLVFPRSISQRQKTWFAFLIMYLYLWDEYVIQLSNHGQIERRYKTHPPRAVLCQGFWTQKKWCHNQSVMSAMTISFLKAR